MIMTIDHELFELIHLIRQDISLKHKQVVPKVQMKIIYPFPTKTVTIEMRNVISQEESKTGILFQGNIHRTDIVGAQHKRIERLEGIVGSCTRDIDEFTALIGALNLTKGSARNA